MTGIRLLMIRTLTPIAWRMNSQRVGNSLWQFGETEADSAWQYLRAMLLAEDQRLVRMLFENVLEELRHSDYFASTARAISRTRNKLPTNQRLCLANRVEDLPYFLAYAHECERSIHEQFDSYSRACELKEVSDVFRRIQEDEEEHEKEAAMFLSESTSAKVGRWLIVRVKAQRLFESYLRVSRSILNTSLTLVLGGIFFLYGSIFVLFKKPAA